MKKISLLILLLVPMIILIGCSKEKPKNNDAYLNIDFYDKFDNEIDSAHLTFLLGNSRKVINHFFEYKNDNDALNECNKQINRITNVEYFKTTYHASRMYYSMYEPDKNKDFSRISKIGFQCQIKSKDINEECKSKLIENFLNQELLGRKDPKSISNEEMSEVLVEITNKLDFFIGTGSCSYTTLGDIKVFFLDDLLSKSKK